ncbi:MAG: iron-sulfur cluster assembly accessory protein [Blastocatellia bacterium AA13]|nr:MAG: iron-sulfur cluster assembly accessory protein [Blastocatellia bacterium AA13]
MAIEITSAAAERIREIMKDNRMTEGGLRVGVKGGGCSGLSYTLSLDSEERPGDKVFRCDDVKLLIDMKSYLYLNGSKLDWMNEGLMQRGFKFINPNESAACGCGESFSA